MYLAKQNNNFVQCHIFLNMKQTIEQSKYFPTTNNQRNVFYWRLQIRMMFKNKQNGLVL
jgi:hypothetical protein